MDIDRVLNNGSELEEDAAWFLSNWRKQRFSIIQPPIVDRRLAAQVAKRIADLYRDAYSITVSSEILVQAITEWAGNPLRNPRRLIRGIVDRIDQKRALVVRKSATAESSLGREKVVHS